VSKISWSIHVPSGHCKHQSGIDAYIASTPWMSYTPVLGPYTCEYSPTKELAVRSTELIDELEKTHPMGHVVFGSLSNSDESNEIEVLGIKKKWLPDLSARSNWLYLAKSQFTQDALSTLLQKEWKTDKSGRSITHSSGIRFNYSAKCFSRSLARMFANFEATSTVEPEVEAWNTRILPEQLHSLGNVGFKALCMLQGISLSARLIQVSPPKSS